MTSIDPKEAASALSDIDDIVGRVRQSRIYGFASLMFILWGALTFAGYLVTWASPRNAFYGWAAVYVAGTAGSIALSASDRIRSGVRTLDYRTLAAFVLFVAFGLFCCRLGHFGPRQLGAFWTMYYALVYTITGLWAGRTFVAIGLSIIGLTLIGYFFIVGAFDLWMAFVNGGGLILGGLWMRRS